MYSLSTHHFADGGVGKVIESTKHFRSTEVNRVAAECNTMKEIGDQIFKHN